MSATHSKLKISRIKPAARCAVLTGIKKTTSCSEMTKTELFTLNRLQDFTSGDFEAYRDRGEEYRRKMSGATLHALNLSDIWQTDCESRNEWGGLFPVHLRLTHSVYTHVTLDILSPSNESPFWHGLIWINTNHTGLYFWNAETLEPQSLIPLLSRIDELLKAGYMEPACIARVLRQGGN